VNPVGVLGSWYSWNVNGELKIDSTGDNVKKQEKHKFIPVELYRGTVRQPFYEKQILKVSALIRLKSKLK